MNSGPLKAGLVALCLFLYGMPLKSVAETYNATVPIVRGDVASARDEAIRDILWEAGLQGGALIQSKSALVQEDYVQSTVVNSRFHLRKFKVTQEEILTDRLKITALIEKEDAAPPSCVTSFPMKNIRFEWRGTQGNKISEGARQGSFAFGRLLGQALREEMGPYLLPPEASSQEAVYRLIGTLEISDPPSSLPLQALRPLLSHLPFPLLPTGVQTVRFQFRAADGTLIKELKFPAPTTEFASLERQNLGYATLSQWVLAPEAYSLLNAVKPKLAEGLKCLPTVARIPETGPDGGFAIATDSAAQISREAIIFFASTWPITENGSIDLTRIDGNLRPQKGNGSLNFVGAKRLPGRKYPAKGGYLVFQ